MRNRRRANIIGAGDQHVFDPGVRAINVLRVATDGADAQTVAIGNDVYELDRAANGVVAGRIPVTSHGDDTPAEVTDALVAAINANRASSVTALGISDNEVLIVAKGDGPVAIACSETLAGADNAWAAATMYGGSGPSGKQQTVLSRVPNATEVALGQMHIALPFNPGIVMVDVRVTNDGTKKAWDGGIAYAANRVTLTNAGDTDWAATDTVKVLAIE